MSKIDPKDLFDLFETSGAGFYCGVPDSLLSSLGFCIMERAGQRHMIAANEGNAVGMAIGHYLATQKVPVVYMQNSGLGNAVNPLTSLATPEVMGIPMLLVIGWRGMPGKADEPQHAKQGPITPGLLEVLDVPFAVLEAESADSQIKELMHIATQGSRPVALLVGQDTLGPYEVPAADAVDAQMSREEAIAAVLSQLDPHDVVVATTGKIGREVYELRQAAGQSHNQDVLTVGGMGHASSLALGISLAQPKRRVVCLDGDGAVLMHMGALAVNATSDSSHLCHVVLNNGSHDSVGGQPTAASTVNLRDVAAACGYHALRTKTPAEIKQALTADGDDRPRLIEVMVKPGSRPELGRPATSPQHNRDQIKEFLAS